MLISTQKGTGGQKFKWYKSEVHNRGAKVPLKSVLVPHTPRAPGVENTHSLPLQRILPSCPFIMKNSI